MIFCMKKITFLLLLVQTLIYAQEQFPGENENNLIYNAGFEEEPNWGNDENNDGWGWECWGCKHAESESLQGYIDDQYDFRVSVPAADGNYFGHSRTWEGTMFQIFEVEGKTQYTVKFKFGWVHYPNTNLANKTVNIAVKDEDDKKLLGKMLLSDNLYATNSSDGSFSELFFESWHEVEFTFTTKDSTLDARFAIWNPNHTPLYIIDNVEVFPTPAASINKFKNIDFKLYPNPTADILNLRSSESISSIKIYNTFGQEVINKNINALSSKIDVTPLKYGVYFIHITVEGITKTYKFQKI